MKKLTVLIALFISTFSYGQFEFGAKAGLSSVEYATGSILIPNGDQNVSLSVREADYGFHFGLYTRFHVANLFIAPSFLFNSANVDYNVEELLFDTGIVKSVKSETFNNLDIPVMVGMKIGFLRIHGGPVAHIFISSTSELTTIEGYQQNFKDASFGIQGGIGLDILKFRVDVNYETNLSQFGDHITVLGQQFAFDERPSRIVASIGMRF
ncbi:MAG: hypothetical protein V3V14_10430 [Saprospiraceae bacterium]